MTISITIQGDDVPTVLHELRQLLLSSTAPANSTAAPAPVAPPASASIGPGEAGAAAPKTFEDQGRPADRDGEAKPKKGGKKPKQTDIEEVTGKPETIEATATVVSEAAMLTIDDARERMRQFCKDGSGEAVYGVLAEFNAQKLSDVDPEAGSKPSEKFAKFIARIEQVVAEAPKPEAV